MNLFFIVPPKDYNEKKSPIDRVYGCNYSYDYKPPIHFLLLATIAKNAGHTVRFLDCPAEKINAEQFEAVIKKSTLDAAVFFTPYLAQAEDLRAAQTIESIQKKKVNFLYVGSAPSWKPEEFISKDNYFVIRGETEFVLADFFQFCQGKKKAGEIGNLVWMDQKGNLIRNKITPLGDVNDFPIPDRTLLKGEYWINRLEVSPATTACFSRSCAFNCIFCAPNAPDQAIELVYKEQKNDWSVKPPLRLRDPELIIKEFQEIKRLGYKGVEVADNEFVWAKERTLEICRGIKDLGLKWICLARADYLQDREVALALHEAGCQMIYIGTESFCQRILDDIKKRITVEDIHKAVINLKAAGIMPEVSVMMGASPNESWETINYSLKEAKKLKTDFLHFSIALPFPNTELYKIAKEKGWIKTGDFVSVDNAKEAIINLPNISADELEKIIKKAYFTQYASPKAILRHLRSVRSPKDLVRKMGAGAKLLGFVLGRYKKSTS